ncbi:MAG: cytidylate kinase [Olpidium bornovanus]|uniref:(d)CMP kinase n=1 Tax=Olpidium bornovanus TaxID=278681 RepID=A0A8H8A048_9FUNG|nr:MAG: cytidylate kinase [Olpidium bornovanus]
MLGFVHVDTGGMYRAITLAAVRAGLDPEPESNADAIAALVAQVHVGFGTAGESSRSSGSTRIFLGAEDVTEAVRANPAVAGSVTAVAKIPAVRSCLVRRQRSFAGGEAPGGLVMDGRDIGTTVFPDADLKVFVVADPHVRALRRWRQEERRGAAEVREEDEQSAVQRIKEDLELRDKQDAERAVSPLRKADDAVVLDTTHLTVDQQVFRIVELARQRMSRTPEAAPAQRPTS